LPDAARRLDKCWLFVSGDAQTAGQQLGQLAGGAALVGLDFAEGGDRTAGAIGQLGAGQAQRGATAA
jgi:hypothetical protein